MTKTSPQLGFSLSCALLVAACSQGDSDPDLFDPGQDEGTENTETGDSDDGDDGENDDGASVIPKYDLGDPGDPDGGCQDTIVQAAAETPHILLVLDKSGSMTDAQWVFQNQLMSRWSSLYLIVESVLGQFDNQADFGASLYPNFDDGCNVEDPVDVPVAPQNGMMILDTLPPPNASFNGPTPLHNGIKVAKAHLEDIRIPDKPQAMILVADGGLSQHCPPITSLDEVEAMIADAWQAEVPTYVLGIDANTPELIDQLNGFAEAGGKALPGPEKFYNANDGDELLENVLEVVQGTLSCTVNLDETPPNPAFTKVLLDGEELPEIEDCEHEDGWYWSNPHTQITMCGTACEDFKATGTAEIKFVCTEG